MDALLLPVVSYAESYNSSCTGTKNYPAMMAYNYMTKKLHIPFKEIDERKTTVEIIDRQKITSLMGKTVVEEKMKLSWGVTPEVAKKMLSETFIEDTVYILTVKVGFQNMFKKRNTFIISSYINDNECSVDEAGLILLNRGF